MNIIDQTGVAEQTVNKSKFLAWASNCQTEKEVSAFLSTIASLHHSASHLAYAFRLKTPAGIILRFSDAGEPSGTAGKPILQLLEGRDLINACVGVIRYYGGVNLGKGGLARAYGSTAKLAIDAAIQKPYVEMQDLSLIVEYNQLDTLINMLAQLGGSIINKTFADKVHLSIRLPTTEVEAFKSRFQSEYKT